MARKDYTTISGRRACETVIKGSRFIGVALPVRTEDDLRARLSEITKEFPEATHYCYGAVFGGSDRMERSSDNGEPSGTAGKPIVTVIRESGLTDCAIVVIRYFGGTLLGTGGLVHAYSESASAVLKLCETEEHTLCDLYSVTIPYSDFDRFTKKLGQFFKGAPTCEYAAEITVRVSVPVDTSEEFLKALTDVTAGRVSATPLGTDYV